MKDPFRSTIELVYCFKKILIMHDSSSKYIIQLCTKSMHVCKYLLFLFCLIHFSCKKDPTPKCVSCYTVVQKNPGPKCGQAYNNKNGGWDEISRVLIDKFCDGEWQYQDGKVVKLSVNSIPCAGNGGLYYDSRIIILCPQ